MDVKNGFSRRIKRYQFSICTYFDGFLYFFSNFSSLGMKMDLITNRITYIEKSKNDIYENPDTVDGMEIVNGKLCILGIKGDCVCTCDLGGVGYNRITIACSEKEWGNYTAYTSYKEDVYIFPRYRRCIIKLNAHTQRVEYITELYKEVEQYILQKNWDYCEFVQGCKVGTAMWLLSENGKLLVSYDMENGETKIYELPYSITNCQQLVYANKKFYFLVGNGTVYTWNFQKIDTLFTIEDTCDKEYEFCRLAVTRQKIYVLPFLGNDIWVYNRKNEKVEKFETYPQEFEYLAPKGWSKYYGYCENEQYYFFAMRSMNYLLKVNKNSGQSDWIKPILPSIEEEFEVYSRTENSMFREDVWDMNEYLHIISLKKDSYVNNTERIGEKIWKRM